MEFTFTRSFGDGNYDSSTGIWSKPSVSPGEPISFSVQGVADDDLAHGTVLEATAELISVDQPDHDSTPNNDDGDQSEDDEAGALAIVSNIIDLELTTSVSPTRVSAGEPLTWTIQVTNNASASVSATGVAISSPLPETIAYVQHTTANGVFDPLTDTWALSDPLAPGETASLQITTEPQRDLPGLTKIEVRSNLETADQSDADSTPGNDSAREDDQDSAELTIDPLIDLELTQSVDVTEASEGDLINFALTVTNNAEHANFTSAVQIRHEVSDGLTLLNATTSADDLWMQDRGMNETIWIVPSLAIGETTTIDLQFEVVGSLELERLTSLAEIAFSDSPDIDSRPGNFGDSPEEDDGAYIEILIPPQRSISGFSYLDTNNDGIYQGSELPIRNTEIRLIGTDELGEPVERSTSTNQWGYYQFAELRKGTYQITQLHAPQFLDGIDSLGDALGSNSINDRFLVQLTGKATNLNFGERGIQSSYLIRFLGFNEDSLDGANAEVSRESFRVVDMGDSLITSGTQLPSVAYRVPSTDVQYSIAYPNVDFFPSAVGPAASLSLQNDTVIAVGTDGDDILELRLGETFHTLSLNGVRFEFDAQQVRTFHIGGSTGEDAIIVRGTKSNDTASVLGDRGEIASSSYSVHTYSFERTTFNGGGGFDTGQLYGSLDDDVFESFPRSYTMLNPENEMHMVDFNRVDGYGRGGNDQAMHYGTNESDIFFSTSEFSIFKGPGHRTKTKGFERIDAYGRGGFDIAGLAGSTSDERFISTLHYAYIATSDRKAVAKDFGEVYAFAIAGGTDLAYYYDLTENDRLFPRRGHLLVERANRTETIYDYQLELADGL